MKKSKSVLLHLKITHELDLKAFPDAETLHKHRFLEILQMFGKNVEYSSHVEKCEQKLFYIEPNLFATFQLKLEASNYRRSLYLHQIVVGYAGLVSDFDGVVGFSVSVIS